MNRTIALAVAIAVPFGTIAYRMSSIFGEPDNISQTFDNIFHLNAVRHILDSGNGSSLSIGGFTSPAAEPSFYPAAWHDFVSLIAVATSSIPAAANVSNIVIAALVWPMSCVALIYQLFPARPAVWIASGVLSAAAPAFPYLMVDFGVLYPNLLSVALLPALIAILINLVDDSRPQHLLYAVLPLVLSVLGVGLAHPSTLVALMALTVPLLVKVLILLHKYVTRRGFPALASYGTIFLASVPLGLIFYQIWSNVRPEESAAIWEPIQTSAQAIGEVISQAPMGRPVAWFLALLVMIGLIREIRNQRFFLPTAMFILAALFIIASSHPPDDFRLFWTGVWYNDSYRLAALLPVAAIPLGALGADLVLRNLIALIERIFSDRPLPDPHSTTFPIAMIIFSLVAIVVLTYFTQGGAVTAATRSAAGNYLSTPDSPLVSSDEAVLFTMLDDIVPEDEVMLNNPYDGSSLAYALADRKTIKLHVFSRSGGDISLLLHDLDGISSDPSICEAAEDLSAFWVLDLGEREVHGGDHRPPSFDDIDVNPGVTLVEAVGDARLYELSACR